MVNYSGISFDHRMTEQTGASLVDIARAWVVASEIAGLDTLWDEIDETAGEVKLAVQLEMFLEARRMVERGVLWLLRHRRPPIDLAATIASIREQMLILGRHYDEYLRGQLGAQVHSTWAGRLTAGVPEGLAERSSVWPLLHTAYDVIEIAHRHGEPLEPVARAYWHVFDEIDVLWLWEGIGALPRSTRWETQARSALRDDLLSALATVTDDVIRSGFGVRAWMEANERAVRRVQAMFTEIRRSDVYDLTTLTVGLRQLSNLVLACA